MSVQAVVSYNSVINISPVIYNMSNGTWYKSVIYIINESRANFCIKRADIAASISTPSWGYDNAFPIPSDCLRVIEIKDVDDYALESVDGVFSIVCDSSGPLYIKYISKVTDTGIFTPLFAELLAVNIAIETVDRITDDSGLKNDLIFMRKEILNRVSSTDAIESSTEYFVEDDWLSAEVS